MSYLRSKVAPVRANPPPGKYPSPLVVHLYCETPEVTLVFTTDGREPVANSLRSHGFQSAVYNEISGIPLKGGGQHVITVLAQRDGFVSSRAKKLHYILEGPPAPRPLQPLGDVIIERRFMAMTSLDPPMPLRLARARTPNLTCALLDTCPRGMLREKRHHGEEVALFELTHNSRSVSRQDTYRRIVPPSLSLPLPQIPNKMPVTEPASLRSTMSNRFALTHYERPDFKRSLTRTKSRQQVVRSSLGVREVYNYHPPPTAIPGATRCQLDWFEARTGLNPNPEEEYDDPTEREELRKEATEAEAVIKAEIQRKATRSPAYARIASPAPVSISEDIAGSSKGFISLIYWAKEFCHSQLAHMLRFVSYQTLQQRFGRAGSVGPAEVADVSGGSLAVADSYKSMAGLPEVAPKQYDAKIFLLLCRYCVWAARPIPEAIFGLALQYWKHQVMMSGSEPRISKMELMLLLDTYRRTRGAHIETLEELSEKIQQLPWGVGDEDGKIAYGVFQSVVSANFSVIDSCLVDMANLGHPMYTNPIEIWGHVDHAL